MLLNKLNAWVLEIYNKYKNQSLKTHEKNIKYVKNMFNICLTCDTSILKGM